MSKFWGIGVGPGDSELLTVQAVNTIKRLDVLYTPQAHKGGRSVAEQIAAPYLSEDLQIKRRHFPMTSNKTEKLESWHAIANEIIQDVKSGMEVGFLTLGDASVYSTYSYIMTLVQDDIEVKTIAGIAAYSQLAADVNLPLMMDDESLAVLSGTDDLGQIEMMLKQHDNVVIMKVSAQFPAIYQLLKAQDLLGKATLITNISMPDQVVTDLETLTGDEKLTYFTTLLMKKHTVKELID